MDRKTQELQKQEAVNPAKTERTKARRVYVPVVDIYETKDSIVLVADLPGADEKSVTVTLEKNVLTVTGQVEPEEFPGYSLSHSEYETGDFERSFSISDEIDRDKVEATVKNGTLRVTLHKSEKVKVKKIPVLTH